MSDASHSSLKSILFALSANCAIAIMKSIGAVLTKSGSLLAEAIHSWADCGNQLLLIVGLKRAKRKPDKQHPLGYGKTIYFWSFLVAIMLFSMGGLFSFHEGLYKLEHPQELKNPWIAVGILIVSIILEALALSGALKQVNKTRKSMSLLKWFKSTRHSELIVVVGEDIAAVAGLAFALIAILLTIMTGNSTYDAIGSLFIGTLLLFVAFGIGIEIKSLLIGESGSDELNNAISQKLENDPRIVRVFNIITLQMGHDVMLSIKAEMKEKRSVKKLLTEINSIEKELKTEHPEILWSFFEPDFNKND